LSISATVDGEVLREDVNCLIAPPTETIGENMTSITILEEKRERLREREIKTKREGMMSLLEHHHHQVYENKIVCKR
jgi:hypothetical protein